MADLTDFKCFENTEYEILTDEGFKDFEGMFCGKNQNKIHLIFESGKQLICTPKHKLMVNKCDYVFANELKVGAAVFNDTVKSINEFENDEKVFEFLEIEDTHTYFANGILNHQCIIIDEMAHIEDHLIEDFWASVIPVISSTRKGTTKIFAVSCVTKDTFVFTSAGIKRVDDFIDHSKNGAYEIDDYSVLGKDGVRSGTVFFNNGIAQTKKITTSSSQLEMSHNHKLWACKNGKYDWYAADQLTVGDFVSIQYGMELWGNNDDVSDFSPTNSSNIRNKFVPNKITTDIAYFLGLFIAEGSTYKVHRDSKLVGGSVNLACCDDLSHVFNTLHLPFYKSTTSVAHTVSSLHLIEFLEYLGFDLSKKAPQKEIPSRLLEMSRANIIALLQGIFDGDGCCTKTLGRIGISLSSERLIQQIRIILNNFGVLTDFNMQNVPPNKLVKVPSVSYRLSCNSKYSAIFLEKIGFRFNRKQQNQNSINRKSTRNTKDVVPFSKKILHRGLKRGVAYKLSKLGISTAKFYTNVSEHVSRDVLCKIKNSTSVSDRTDELTMFLDQHVSPSLKWEQIKTIEDGENEVYDFSLPHNDNDQWCHSVIYNGVIGHQTPRGTGNKFHEIYTQAETGEQSDAMAWVPERIDWWEVPGRGKKWKASMMIALGGDPQQFAQEFENAFLETGESAIDASLIDYFRQISRQPEFIFENGSYKVWQEPKSNRIYGIGVDVAEGVGKASSVVQVLDFTDLTNIEQVAVYSNNHIHPTPFAEVINRIGQHWGSPPILIERNSCGAEVITALNEKHNYTNIVSYNPDNTRKQELRLGVYSHTNTKYHGVMNMRYWLNTLKVVNIYDINTVSELQTFVRYPNGTWKAKQGNSIYDDKVMALVWALFLLFEQVCEHYYEVIDYDDNGKPLKIRNWEIVAPSLFGLDPFFQRDEHAPLPTIIGWTPQSGQITQENYGPQQLLEQGWRLL